MNMERFTLFVNWRKGGGYIALWDLSKEKKSRRKYTKITIKVMSEHLFSPPFICIF